MWPEVPNGRKSQLITTNVVSYRPFTPGLFCCCQKECLVKQQLRPSLFIPCILYTFLVVVGYKA